MAQKPKLAKGTRDFSPVEVAKRNYIIEIVKTQFQRFGFQPIETPSFERSTTLLGKYGEEGDRLIFKILDSGNFLRSADEKTLQNKDSLQLAPQISKKALRYDLTVPFARYVVQHQNELTFPFKRYQIQPVWRADRPQKGRFREFFQCDADVVGSKSLWQEVEFIKLYDLVFTDLGVKGVTIKLNNRKVLSGFAEVIGEQDKLIPFTVALDKLDKIGEEGVKKEMLENGISQGAIDKIRPIFNMKGDFVEKLDQLRDILETSEIGKKGIEELAIIRERIKELPLETANLDLDVTLARGLDYYTGTIIEVAAPEKVSIGSIGGGGRYDDLTGIFGLKNMGGMGVSFGLDRIFLVLEELKLFPKTILDNAKLLFVNFGDKEALYALRAIFKLREEGINAELFPEATKMGKQMGYADKRDIPLVVLAGTKEMEEQKYTLKNMRTGEQRTLDFAGLIEATSEVVN